jgi:hypothetical protein
MIIMIEKEYSNTKWARMWACKRFDDHNILERNKFENEVCNHLIQHMLQPISIANAEFS